MFYLNRVLVLYSAREISTGKEFKANGPKLAARYVKCSWAFILEPIDKTSTRLVLRTRANVGTDQWPQFIYFLFTLWQRLMLDGIKEHVEQANKAKTLLLEVEQE